MASTTVLSSTSGLFTLFVGVLLRQDSLNMAKVVAVFVSMAGVVMTTLGKTWAADESQMSTARYILCVGCSLLWLTRDIHISFYAFFKFYFRTLNLILGRISYNSSSFLYHISHQ